MRFSGQNGRVVPASEALHCLDNATENSARLQMWSCTGGQEQNWLESTTPNDVYTNWMVNEHTGLCMTAPATGTGPVTMAVCTDALNQQWRPEADGHEGSSFWDLWLNQSSGNCLDTSSVANGTVPTTAPCGYFVEYQRWHQH